MRRPGQFSKIRNLWTRGSQNRADAKVIGDLCLSWEMLHALHYAIYLRQESIAGEGVREEKRVLARLSRRIESVIDRSSLESAQRLSVTRVELQAIDEALECDASCEALIKNVEQLILTEALMSETQS